MKKALAAVSTATLALLYGVLAAVIAFICIICNVNMGYVLLTAVVVILVQFLISPFLTDLNMRWFYKTRFDRPVPEFVTAFVQELCQQNNMKMPRIGIIEDGAPNAFTYGHTKNNARIVITRGLLNMLDEDEAKAVIAHEMGHAVHYDMLVMTAVQLVPMVLYYLYDVLRKAATEHSDNSKSESGKSTAALLLVALVIYILYIISEYIILWLSRTREYYADEFAARSTADPNALASALVQVGFGLSVGSDQHETKRSVSSPSTLGIADAKAGKGMALCCMDGDVPVKENIKRAMRWDMWNVWAKLYELQSTHPLISKRILALSELSGEYGQAPYIVFDEEKPESYVDDFAKEVLISALPGLALLAGAIAALVMENVSVALIGLAVSLTLSIFKLRYSHPNGEFIPVKVSDLLGEVKVSHITSIPCEIHGVIIGRGDPGCVFSEDFVLRDESGIIFLNYNRPLNIQNKLFALFRAQNYQAKEVTAIGWYRRGPSPYVDLKYLRSEDAEKRCDRTRLGYILRGVGIALCLAAAVILAV